MNTHDKIELPPLPPADRYFEFDSHRMKASIDIPYWGEKSLEAYARAAIEADCKRTADLLKNPIHVHSNMCRGIIAPITFDMLAHVLGEEATNEWLRKRRGEPVLVGWAVGTTGGGLLHASKYTEYEARRAGYSLPLYRLTATQPAVQSDAEVVETCRAMRANSFAEFFGKTAPQPAEPGSTHHVHRGTESLPCYCNGTYDHPIGKETLEPVKVPSDSAIMFEWSQTPNTGDMRVDLVAFARALLARYSHLTATTHKSSNQNQLKG